MKLTVIVSPLGKVYGTTSVGPRTKGMQAMLVPPPGHTVHEIDLPDEDRDLSATELHEKLNGILATTRPLPTAQTVTNGRERRGCVGLELRPDLAD